jgi:thymidylate synthase (FAD)
MKLIKPSFEILTYVMGEKILKDIELAARTCYKSEGKIEYEDRVEGEILLPKYYAKSARVLIPKLIKMGHEAMLEFGGNITVKFICDRGVSHELVRHRIASFAQESTRYCNYEGKKVEFIFPLWLSGTKGTAEYGVWVEAMQLAEMKYNALISNYGWSPQQARAVLPNSLKTEINMSTNIREWRHIFKLRTAKAAHPQMRELMCPLLTEFQKKIPILFDDITYSL